MPEVFLRKRHSTLGLLWCIQSHQAPWPGYGRPGPGLPRLPPPPWPGNGWPGPGRLGDTLAVDFAATGAGLLPQGSFGIKPSFLFQK